MNKSPWVPIWATTLQVAGDHEIPTLEPAKSVHQISGMVSSSRYQQREEYGSLILHGYLADQKLNEIYRNPSQFLSKASKFSATVTPDFSILSEMPTHQRIRSVVQSREIGAYLQTHGINVIPNIRWAELTDLKFVIDGLPKSSTICVSTQGIIRDRSLRKIFIDGLANVLSELSPSQLIIYGTAPNELDLSAWIDLEILNFPTDFNVLMSKAAG